MSSLGVFNLNDMVFIQNIGYGTLMDCGNLKSIPIKQLPTLGQKRESIYFDPQLFNSQSETFVKQKSQTSPTLLDVKVQQNKSQSKSQSNVQSQQNKQQVNPKIQQEIINIVKIRLEGSNTLVYTPDKNIRKYVNIPIKPLFLPAFGTLNIKIQIGKTIQSLKRQIFDLLGLKHAHYFNVKLFTTSPNLGQLNCQGKTIWQYGIKQSSILTMTAEHGFCFQQIPSNLTQYFSITNNNLTFLSLPRKPKVVSNIVIALPPAQTPQVSVQIQTQNTATQPLVPVVQPPVQIIQPQVQAVQVPLQVAQPPAQIMQVQPVVATQSKNQQKKKSQQDNKKPNQEINNKEQKNNQIENAENKNSQQRKAQTKQQSEQKKKQEGKQIPKETKQEKQKQKQVEVKIPDILFVNGDKIFKSGRHYFEIRLDKLPHNLQNLQVGVSSDSKKWLYSPLTFQKIYKQQNQVKLKQNYGMSFKQNDLLGVLVKIDKQKNMKLYYFRNSINLGQCFEAKIQQAFFTFGIGTEGQISLDSRIQPPLDSYRFR